jgi:hypothetical protein
MSTITNLDVLVVYSAGIAESATIPDSVGTHPFRVDSKRANYNLSYDYFLEACHDQGITAGFACSSDIIGPGTTQSYWTSNNNKWTKINQKARSNQIFTKLSPVSAKRKSERQLLLSDPTIKTFNDQDLRATFFDKLRTHLELPNYSIPTVSLRSAKLDVITNSLARLRALVKKHPFRSDFSSTIILKDRYGAGGNYIYKITHDYQTKIAKLMADSPHITFVLQPFLRFNQGYLHHNQPTTTDIRLIYQHNQVIQSYLRIAKKDEFLCNEHQGGELIYVPESSIPSSILKIGNKLTRKINKPHELYALDFVLSILAKFTSSKGTWVPVLTGMSPNPKTNVCPKN